MRPGSRRSPAVLVNSDTRLLGTKGTRLSPGLSEVLDVCLLQCGFHEGSIASIGRPPEFSYGARLCHFISGVSAGAIRGIIFPAPEALEIF